MVYILGIFGGYKYIEFNYESNVGNFLIKVLRVVNN